MNKTSSGHITSSRLVTDLAQLMDKLLDISISALVTRDRRPSLLCEYTGSELEICSCCQMTRRNRMTRWVSLRRTVFLRGTSHWGCQDSISADHFVPQIWWETRSCHHTGLSAFALQSTLQVNHFSSLDYGMSIHVPSISTDRVLRKGTRQRGIM